MAERGRPSKYSPAYCDEVIAAGEEGLSLTAFGGIIGVCRDTLNEWTREHPEFSDAVKIHKAKRSLKWERRLSNCADTGDGNATSIIFALKNVAPEEFADRHESRFVDKDGNDALDAMQIARAMAFMLQQADRGEE